MLFKCDRAVYYASIPILQEIRSGDLRYHLTPRYVLAFLHFGLQHEGHRHWQDGTESRYEILEKYTHEKLSDALNLVFVELGRFRKNPCAILTMTKKGFTFVCCICTNSPECRKN